MKRLLLWNLLLTVCVTTGARHLRRTWLAIRAQQQQALSRNPPAHKIDAAPLPAQPALIQAATYHDIAQKMLFSSDRNPDIAIAPPPSAPPVPMPALPHLYGVLNLPSGPVALMSIAASGLQKKVHVTENIGEFKLARLDTERIALEWRDKTVEKSIDDLLDRGAPTTLEPVPATRPPANSAPSGPPQMGVEIGTPGHSIRACLDQTVETSPPGTVMDGYRKSSEPTPFTPACRWLPVQ